MDYKIIAGIGLGVIAGAMFLVWAAVQVYNRVENPRVRDPLQSILFLLDEQCDNMELPAKRSQTIMAVQALLGWRRIFIPGIIIGLLLDLMVKLLRKTGIPDLHKTDQGPAMAPDPTDKEGTL